MVKTDDALWHARYGQDASIIIFSHNGVMRCLYKYISTLQGYQFHTDNDYVIRVQKLRVN